MFALDTLGLIAALTAANIAPPTCPSFPADPAELVPSTATVVLGVDVDALAQTPAGKALLPALRADLQLSEALEILDDCQLSLERTYALTLARDPGDGRFAVVQARGIGTSQTAACLAAELRARNDGAPPWTVEPQTCATSLALADGSRAWLINDYTLVWASGSFIDPVSARLEAREPLALPSTLAREFSRLDRSGHLWLAAQLDDHDRQTLPFPWAQEASSITAAIDLAKGLHATFTISAPNVAATANIRELTIAGLLDLDARLDEYGVEHQLRERARVGIVDGVVGAELTLNQAELHSIRTNIAEKLHGRGPV
ncbi:hypothetical protein [Enhygromyxa salina]|uniref:Uncharacterized protein n=1 Tax=Enhygromyxa salina TaxID=215803 RepID=A0A2S9YKU4_9BACT|nr:hypothetical protein [Enhygromyxa salina]PRQ05656.1 hypothetical protein ENSA7_45460 [Enhygromyxa salina]